MSNSYKEIYNKLIGEKFNTVVIRYSPEKGKYEYRGFSHHAEKNALDNIANLIIDDMIFYAFSENEILRLNDDIDLLEDLRAAAKYAYIERLPKREKAKSDGTMSEVLLDIIIQLASQNTKKLIARAKHTEIKNKKEITGYDALYFTKDAEGISLWLGQAKAGQKAYCKRSIIKDLQEKYKREYFADTAFYIADKNEAPELLYLLAKSVKEYYLAGPYLNLNQVKKGMQIFLKDNNITPIQIEFEPTSRIEIDAWKMNGIEYHPILGEIKKQLYAHAGPSTKEKVQGIVKYLQENRLGQAIFYCSTPSNSMKYTRDIIEAFSEEKEKKIPYDFIEHLKKKYNVKIGKSKDSTMYWSLVQALENGIGIHHGKFPKYVQNEVLRLFNNGDFDYLFCTSTIIEGVNTNAKNVVIINNSVGNTTMTAFALKNIKGRAGRYYHHAMGRVFYTDSKQRQIENADDMQLNFQTYDTHPILNADIDNASLDDLAEENRNIKVEREEKFNRNLLSDNVFIKNRLYPRDVQEKYLNYIMQTNVFQKFVGLIGNSSNIHYFLTNKVINVILETFEETQILDTNKAKVYYSVVSTYSQNGTIGILQYHIGKLQENNSMFEEKIDSAYIKAFEQIRNIVEYEIPKLLCLFESLFQQAGKLLGYNMDDFNLSSVIRFFELGITTELGLFLVEFGFPTDTIRALENKYPSIGKMGALEAATFLSNNQRAMYSVMDAYEQELFKRAMQVLVKRG